MNDPNRITNSNVAQSIPADDLANRTDVLPARLHPAKNGRDIVEYRVALQTEKVRRGTHRTGVVALDVLVRHAAYRRRFVRAGYPGEVVRLDAADGQQKAAFSKPAMHPRAGQFRQRFPVIHVMPSHVFYAQVAAGERTLFKPLAFPQGKLVRSCCN